MYQICKLKNSRLALRENLKCLLETKVRSLLLPFLYAILKIQCHIFIFYGLKQPTFFKHGNKMIAISLT